MGWLRTLFGRGRVNPDEYERVRCDACRGTGLRSADAGTAIPPSRPIIDSQAAYVSALSHPSMSTQNVCRKCDGKGWLTVRRGSDEVRNRPEEHPNAVADAERVTGGSFDEAPAAEGGGQPNLSQAAVAPAAPDVPVAPTAPSPPRELGEN